MYQRHTRNTFPDFMYHVGIGSYGPLVYLNIFSFWIFPKIEWELIIPGERDLPLHWWNQCHICGKNGSSSVRDSCQHCQLLSTRTDSEKCEQTKESSSSTEVPRRVMDIWAGIWVPSPLLGCHYKIKGMCVGVNWYRVDIGFYLNILKVLTGIFT